MIGKNEVKMKIDFEKVKKFHFREIKMGEKPRVEACRVGRMKSGKTVRPVKVTTFSSTVVDQILLRSGKLRSVDLYKNVFVNPDRQIKDISSETEKFAVLPRLHM